jgi:multidrug/hemolysin transport system ATP-binding protein
MQEIISVRKLTKRYGELTAVDQVSFSVHEGSLFAFLGPNGAGKTTTINVICTLMGKTDGEVIVDGCAVGKDDSQIRKKIGVVFQDNVLDDLLTVKENLMSRGSLYHADRQTLVRRLEQVASIMDISDLLNRRYGKLSGGQRRRCEIGRALMSDPKILFLDEPTTGLDPQTRISVWKTIRQLQRDLKMTVFLTTHYMEEAAGADWVAIIDGGKIVAEGTPHDLKEQYSTDQLRLTPNGLGQTESWLKERGLLCEKVADQLIVPVRSSLEALGILQELAGTFSAFEVVSGNMDDVFINITGHKIREDN